MSPGTGVGDRAASARAASLDDDDAIKGVAIRDVAIKGNATPDDVAAVLATLRELATRVPAVDGYERWRRDRLAALRRTPPA